MSDGRIYTVGGTVQANEHGIYLTRPADDELLALCREGKFAYILTARQLGKSSLITRTATVLRQEGWVCAYITLEQISTATPEADVWYKGLIAEFDQALGLKNDIPILWANLQHLTNTQRLIHYLEQNVLTYIRDNIVIFIDEIDTVLRLDYRDDFFVVIRSLYNTRAIKPELRRLSFVLVGVATPSELIGDPNRTPFNIGQRVELNDFTFEQALPLAQGLGLPSEQAQTVLHQVFEWTNGHPYLTQRLCQILRDSETNLLSNLDVDRCVAAAFFGECEITDNNLQFVSDMLTRRVTDRREVLRIYDVIQRGGTVADDRRSVFQAYLKLSGIVRSARGYLQVRNKIYEHVFDEAWISRHLSAFERELRLPTRFEPVDGHDFFIVGGTLHLDAKSYLERPADEQLFNLCYAGELVYVLAPRQCGKSSLMVRTARRLRELNVQVAIVDLTAIGPGSEEAWYLGIIDRIERSVRLNTDIKIWVQEHKNSSSVERFMRFCTEILLNEISEPVIIFFDEIDSALALPFRDSFFAAIRSLFNQRATNSILSRLSFVLLGVAAPNDLIADPTGTPFNIGTGIELRDFTREELTPLARGLDTDPVTAFTLLDRVHYWTNGHPYLTQLLCKAIAESAELKQPVQLDQLIADSLFGKEGFKNSNLAFVQDFVFGQPSQLRLALLQLYRRVYRGQTIPANRRDAHQIYLLLVGLVQADEGVLRVRNRIYEHVFDEAWIRATMPRNRLMYIAIILVMISVIIVVASILLASLAQ